MKKRWKIFFTSLVFLQLSGCATYYSPMGSIRLLSPVNSRVEMESLIAVVHPILVRSQCGLIKKTAYEHPVDFVFHYTYDCEKNIQISLKNEEIRFDYLSGNGKVNEMLRPEKKDWHYLFILINTNLNQKWATKLIYREKNGEF